jgi:hypothetical protein
MEGFIFWDIAQCTTLKVNLCFAETCCYYLQSRRISKARYQHEAGTIIYLLDITHCLFSLFKSNVSETELCIHSQVEAY